MNRTDRTLVAGALVLLLLATLSLMGFDRYFRLRSRVDVERSAVAEIVEGRGDFRMRFHDEFQWEKGRERQKLVFDDAVFTGEDGRAALRVGESYVSLQANTLVIIRQDKTFKNLNLNHGGMSAQIAKSDRFMIETADGQRFQVTAVENTKIEIVSDKKGTRLLVKAGNAKVTKDGRTQNLKARDDLNFGAREVEPDPIQFVNPTRGRVYSRNGHEVIRFEWSYSSRRKINDTDEFTLEVGPDAELSTVLVKERLLGRNVWEMAAEVPSQFFYRVKDKLGNLSEIRPLSLIKPPAPHLTKPEEGLEISLQPETRATLELEVSGVGTEGQIRFQVSNDPEFKSPVIDKRTFELRHREMLLAGKYYARALSIYDGVESEWSEVRLVKIVDVIDERRLAQLDFPARIYIANNNYPSHLYSGSFASVQNYLQKTPPFSSYFAKADIAGYTLAVKVNSMAEVRTVLREFPADWIRPGTTEFVYMYKSDDRTVTDPRRHRLLVEMEPPRISVFNARGFAKWTPILFARSYEVTLNDETGRTERIVTADPRYRLKLRPGHTYFLKTRALGEQGVPISDWSKAASIEKPGTLEVVREVAQQAIPAESSDPKPSRPSEVQNRSSLSVGIDEVKDTVVHFGSWIWAGVGANFYSVRQSIADTADVEYRNLEAPSTFLEAGFLSSKQYGVVGSFKRTPGDIQIEGQSIADSTFIWDTYSIEGLYAFPMRNFIFGLPILWGARAGVQYHQFPFLYVETGRTVLKASNQLLMASLGAFAETQAKKLNYHWLLRYQHPLSASTAHGNTFSVDPTMAFDGLLGVSYRIRSHWRTGLFWYGQLHDYKFTYGSQTRTSEGEQTLFFSNMEFRLGFDF